MKIDGFDFSAPRAALEQVEPMAMGLSINYSGLSRGIHTTKPYVMAAWMVFFSRVFMGVVVLPILSGITKPEDGRLGSFYQRVEVVRFESQIIMRCYPEKFDRVNGFKILEI